MPQVFAVELTKERLASAAVALEAALWAQNERLYQRLVALRSRLVSPRAIAVLGASLAALGLVLSLALWPLGRGDLAILFAPVFAALGVVFAFFPRSQRWIRRKTRALVAWRARHTMDLFEKAKLLKLEYELEGAKLLVRSAKGTTMVDLGAFPFAIATPGLVSLFDRKAARTPKRCVFTPPEMQAPIRAALAAAKAEVEELAP